MRLSRFETAGGFRLPITNPSFSLHIQHRPLMKDRGTVNNYYVAKLQPC